METRQIHISIRTAQPLTGDARTEIAGPLHFEGWIELLHALATLIEDDPDPPTAQDGCHAGDSRVDRSRRGPSRG